MNFIKLPTYLHKINVIYIYVNDPKLLKSVKTKIYLQSYIYIYIKYAAI